MLRVSVKNSFFSDNFSEPPFKVLFVSFNGSGVDEVCMGNYKQELISRSVGKKTCCYARAELPKAHSVINDSMPYQPPTPH